MIHINSKQILIPLLAVLMEYSFLDCTGIQQKTESSSQNVDFLIKQGKITWNQRTDSLSLKRAEHFTGLAHVNRPDNFEVAVLYGRILYTRALFYETDPDVQDELFTQGYKICQSAVMSHSEFAPLYENAKGDSTSKLLSALEKAPKSVVSGLYWWIENFTRHINTKPAIERLNYRDLVEIIMFRILTLDPGYHYSGPYRFFGSLYTRIPGIELSQSETYFNQALSNHANYLGNAVHMAEFYHQKAGNREQFHKILKDVIKTELTEFPEVMVENLLYQKRAQYLLSQEPLLFE